MANRANTNTGKDRRRGTLHFVVVRSPSLYNGIIERPGVRKLQAVSSTAHKMLKLLVEGGVITLKSSRLVPLECVMVSGPEGTPSATNPMVEERVKVAINPEYLEQTIMIGSTFTEEGRNKLCGLLQRNLDIFFLETCGYDRCPKTYCGTPLERARGMFSGQAKEKRASIGEKPSNTGRSRKAHGSRNNEGSALP
ncbi:hypothetical protein Tco_0558004 [Tanacetum coccineum]